MHVAFLLPDLHLGGAERATLDLAMAVAAAGHRVSLLLMTAAGPLLAEAQATLPVVDLGVARVRELVRPLASQLKADRPDALIAAMWPLTVVAPLARRISGHPCRLILAEHALLSRQYRRLGLTHGMILRASLALGLRAADARVGVSSGVVADVATLAGMRQSAFAVVPNPVPARAHPDAAAREEAEREWRAPRGSRMLTVGRLKPEKNHGLMLEAFARLREREDATLMIVGDGPERARMEALAGTLGIAGRVRFAGLRVDPSAHYATADLFLLSSEQEGFGNVLVEAMHAGLKIVSTDCPAGPREVLEDGRHGLLVPPGDASAFAAAIETALAAPPPDQKLLRARAAAFAPATAASRYLDLITGN
jgi:glycosyltransferase involved in cell wall biosynthesis